MQAQQATPRPQACTHCGLPVPASRVTSSAEQFCCAGCECVYALINRLGLEEFYEQKQKLAPDAQRAAQRTGASFQYLDDPTFLKRARILPEAQESIIVFRLAGIHCAACVWLLERLPKVLPGVLSAQVNFSTSEIRICFDNSQLLLSQIAALLDSLGYPPIPVIDRQESARQKQSERRMLLIRLAVAGMSAGNTMMLAVSLYQGWFSGIAQEYAALLIWTSCLFALPAVTFSAFPFYRAALAGLRTRCLHIDLPISLGITLGFAASVLNAYRGSLHVYFDSICMLIFLLLLGRWLQRAAVDSVIERSQEHTLAVPQATLRYKDSSELEEVFIDSLQPGERILVQPAAVIPVDGLLVSGETLIDRSVLTGESRPIPSVAGDTLWAGSRNLKEDIVVEIQSIGAETRMGLLLRELEFAHAQKSPLTMLTDRISSWFVFVVLSAAAICAAYWGSVSGFDAALEHTLALLVVSCPCALGLSAPITLSIALHRAAAAGILIKSPATFEMMQKISAVCFDKTGTLTEGAPRIERIIAAPGQDENSLLQLAVALEGQSIHPVAHALLQEEKRRGLAVSERPVVHGGQSVSAKGVLGVLQEAGTHYLGSIHWLESLGLWLSKEQEEICEEIKSSGSSPVALANESKLLAIFSIGDQIRQGARDCVEAFKQSAIEPIILSGDYVEVVQVVGARLGIEPENCHGQLLPEEKAKRIEALQPEHRVLMLGDGINDAGALQLADVGVAMCGGVEAGLQCGDVYLEGAELGKIQALRKGSRRALRVVQRNLGFSLMYNLFGSLFAVAGVITPLGAAILMPLSSLTVVLSSALLGKDSFRVSRRNSS